MVSYRTAVFKCSSSITFRYTHTCLVEWKLSTHVDWMLGLVQNSLKIINYNKRYLKKAERYITWKFGKYDN